MFTGLKLNGMSTLRPEEFFFDDSLLYVQCYIYIVELAFNFLRQGSTIVTSSLPRGYLIPLHPFEASF